uniref:PiggyBac transposable element-derived protein 4 n=1 Tax=Talaromyces marneffei PM1 TaxID=1077442 RepID=A0A093Y0T9_TALMA
MPFRDISMALAPSNIVTEMYPPGSDPQPILTGKRAEAVAILKQIPEANEVRFEPIQTDKKRAPKLQIPPYIDIMEPYQIFSLFFTEDLFKVLADNTNMYAYAKLSKNMNPHPRNWRSTTPGELKAFVGAQIYMGFTKEPQLKDYWDEEKHNKSVHANHPLSNYITCFRFEQLKRFFHISEPSEVPGGFISTYYRPEPTEEEELQLSEEN